MNRLALVLSTILLINANTLVGIAQTYEIAKWSGFRTAAVSYTFDDGCPNQLAKAVPIFDELDFKLTLFTVINYAPNWPNLLKAAQNGHEIANHTVSHPNLGGITVAQQKEELVTCNNIINNNIGCQKVTTHAYPYCAKADESLCQSLFIAARGCQGYIESATPLNFMNVSSIVCGTEGAIKTEQDFEVNANAAASQAGWLVYLIHGIDNDGGYSSIASTSLKASLNYLKANKDKFWVATFSNVAKYIKERNSIEVRSITTSSTEITLSATDKLDDALYNFPITIRTIAPVDWVAASASQNNNPIPISFVEINSKKYMVFDVVPDGGIVKLTKTISCPNNLTQKPYLGNPVPQPGKVEAENYNVGCMGVAYFDADVANQGKAYRADEVDVEACTDGGGGFNIGYLDANEWLNYNVDVAESGHYTFEFRVASKASTEGAFHVEVDNADITGKIIAPITGEWQKWQTISVKDVILARGAQNIKIVIEAGGFNLNYFNTIPFTITGLDEREEGDLINIFPNPFDKKFSIRVPNFHNGDSYQVGDVTGKVVIREQILQEESSIEMSGYPNGIYFVRVSTDDCVVTKKAVKFF